MIRAETETMLAEIQSTRDAPTSQPRPRIPLAGALGRHAVLILVSLVFLLPFYWMVISAFKTKRDIFARPPEWWPDPFQWVNLQRAFENPYFPYWKLLGNSIFYDDPDIDDGFEAPDPVLTAKAIARTKQKIEDVKDQIRKEQVRLR